MLLTDGQSFGESDLYRSDAKRSSTVMTHSYCQLMILTKAAVDTVLHCRPQQHQQLMEKATQLYQEKRARRRGDMTEDLQPTGDDAIQGLDTGPATSPREDTLEARPRQFHFASRKSAAMTRWQSMLLKAHEPEDGTTSETTASDPRIAKIVDDVAELKASVNALLEMAQQRAVTEDSSGTKM